MRAEELAAQCLVDLGGDGPELLFCHGNGFPLQMYGELLGKLREGYALTGFQNRSFWSQEPPHSVRSWQQFADDLEHSMDARGMSGVHAIGHSMGAITLLLVAKRRPELFRSLCLIEPVLLPEWVYWYIGWMPVSWRITQVPPAKIAVRRRDQWPDREAAFSDFRSKRAFAMVSDADLRAYTEHGLVPQDEGVTLRCSKAWEARLYAIPAYPYGLLKQVKLPILGMRGGRTNVINDRTWRRWKRLQPAAKLLEMPNSGHLLPVEEPQACGQAILEFLADQRT